MYFHGSSRSPLMVVAPVKAPAIGCVCNHIAPEYGGIAYPAGALAIAYAGLPREKGNRLRMKSRDSF